MFSPKRVVEIYRNSSGREPFSNWLKSLKDPIMRARVRKRISRIEEGNLGDFKSLGGGVFELRLMFGPGYRVYLGKQNERLVILLCGGDKSSQEADIEKAKELWKELKESK